MKYLPICSTTKMLSETHNSHIHIKYYQLKPTNNSLTLKLQLIMLFQRRKVFMNHEILTRSGLKREFEHIELNFMDIMHTFYDISDTKNIKLAHFLFN